MTRNRVFPIGIALVVLLSPPSIARAVSSSVDSRDSAASSAKGSRCPSPLGCGPDVEAAVDLEEKIEDNLWYGLALPVEYNTPERIPGDVKEISAAWGDAGIWSGSYLAAESFRYALARRKLTDRSTGRVAGGGRDFWQAQLDESKARIDQLAAQIDIRTNIARSWRSELAPSADLSQLPPGVDFGGGVVQGEPGMLMFSCAPTDAPPGFGMSPNSDVRGPWHWGNEDGRPARLTLPDGDYVCEASTTRDAYAGTMFGLLTAFDLVSADDPELRDLIRDDVLAIANFLLKYGWSYARPHGNVAVPPFGDLDDNVVNPLMVLSPTYRLGLTQAARHVARQAGPPEEALKWEAVWAEEFATQASAGDAISNLANDPSPTAGYYGWNLAHLMYFNLVRLAEGPVERSTLRRDFSIIDRQTSDDVNAFFETVAYSMTGERWRLDAAVTHVREWRDYRAKLDQGGETNNTARCGTEIECVPADEYDIVTDTPAGQARQTVPGSSTKLRAVEPLPIPDRRPTDFLWQRSPFTAMDGSVEATHQEPGIDYLLPYWMLRYYTEVAPPALDPIPTWVGPAYSGT